ncbi:unnamed protein product [Clonostachys chloroleuca]|uniref:Uncharacterized protein n=1 Tax=Clonostachys chloroleuca TaxID=1926264 RepID=A0AA35QEH5_9HYPO|nr:unnamed protein product [Clonostachys chloroleuca]
MAEPKLLAQLMSCPTLQQSSASQKYRYQRRLRARTSGAVARCTEACERPDTATKTFHYEASKTSTHPTGAIL